MELIYTEFILNIIGIIIIFTILTRIMYIFTKNDTEPTWLNVFCAMCISTVATIAIVAVIVIQIADY